MYKRTIFIGFLVLAIILSGCQSPASSPTATPSDTRGFSPVVSVTGELTPAAWATLSALVGGRVVEVLVEPGDQVETGSPLVLLDTSDLELALEIAQQEVVAQKAALAQLRSGTSAEVIARADRDNEFQVAQAEIALMIKQKQLEQARLQDPASDVQAAQAQIKQLQEHLAQANASSLDPEVVLAQVELERAKIALDDTQNEYGKALDRPWEDQKIRDGWAKQLKQVQLDYRAAQAQLDSALNAQKAHAAGLRVLNAQLDAANIGLGKALDAQAAYSVTLDVLNAEIQASQQQLEHLKGWENPYRDAPSADQIAQLEARIEQAELQVNQIVKQMGDATIVAPFNGTVGAVQVRVGELILSGQPLVVVGDLTTLRVETTDLDEIDVAQVELEQQATISFDALPERTFAGRVARISPMAKSGAGGVNYTVIIELEKLDPALRWGMTAFVDIETGK